MKFLFSPYFNRFDLMTVLTMTLLVGSFNSFWVLLLLVPCSFISAHIEKKYGF